jgi:hypothetical protein
MSKMFDSFGEDAKNDARFEIEFSKNQKIFIEIKTRTFSEFLFS